MRTLISTTLIFIILPILGTFASPKEYQSIDWYSYLNGSRLTFINSNYTGGYGGGGAKVTIDLCRNGYFHYHSESSVYVPDAGGYGSASNVHVYGSWKIIRKNGIDLLYGKDTQGQEAYYRLQMGSNGKIYVEGAKYYVQRGKARC
ncbi:MAG: hypothetical protein MRZ79_21965 [Bacteroidia bacterium]|nr:hypothetical protein [Bacteroidia bacterium]